MLQRCEQLCVFRRQWRRRRRRLMMDQNINKNKKPTAAHRQTTPTPTPTPRATQKIKIGREVTLLRGPIVDDQTVGAGLFSALLSLPPSFFFFFIL